MTIQTMKLSDIEPADYNPRIAMKDGDPEYEALKKNLEKYKLVEPLVWNKRTKTLVSGHQRVKALLAIGETEAEVSVVDLPLEDEKLLNISLNKIKGDWDFEKLDELLASLSNDVIQYTGFTEDDIDTLYTEDDLDLTDPDDELPKPKEEKDPEPGKYIVYLSFVTIEAAEDWLASMGMEAEFNKQRAATITMRGAEYDSGN